MLWGDGAEFDSDKAKNIRQTEILVDLRDAILQVARHFQSIDPKNVRVVRALVKYVLFSQTNSILIIIVLDIFN